MSKYKVAQVGCGNRGKAHIKGFLDNDDRFRFVGLCDLDREKMQEAADRFSVDAPLYTDAEKMLAETKPDVFCFVTPPNVRLSMVELAVKHNIPAIAFEKPMATSIGEARTIRDLCVGNNRKAVVCHQQKYLTSMQRIKQIVDAGEIGEIKKIHINTQAWLSQLGTHYVDYALWMNGGKRAKWSVGHVHGPEKLTDNHPSPDFITGVVLLENGVRVYLECGYLSEQNLTSEEFFFDNRLTVYGSHGYAWAETNGAWNAYTKNSGGTVIEGQEMKWPEEVPRIQALYLKDLADWLDGTLSYNPCNVEISYHGYEILEGMCISALDNIRVDLPLPDGEYKDIIERMKQTLKE